MKVSTVEEMRALDRKAISDYGIKDELLMENAGLAVSRIILDHVETPEAQFAVICGSGNNGGDGLVIARQLHSRGSLVRVVLAGDPARFTGAAAVNYTICTQLGLPVDRIESAEMFDDIILSADVIVDALLGTGLTKEVSGVYAEIIEQINSSGLPVVSVDIPSGVNGNTGQIMGTAVEADITVTLGLPKLGNLLYPGFAAGGALFVSHLSFPPELTDSEEIRTAVNVPSGLPDRSEFGHKGTFGDVLFIAGAPSYLGAPYFAAMSFLKAGGGYSRLAAPAAVVQTLGAGGSEIVFMPQQATKSGAIAASSAPALLAQAGACDLTVIGPGLSRDPDIPKLIGALLPDIERPVLVDGDGLTAVCGMREVVKRRSGGTIMTPHPGEMARLAGMPIGDVLSDPVDILRRTAGSWNAVIVLKGAHSLIGLPDGRVFINLSGNSGMASAGSGDVLAGTIAAMYGLGLPVEKAVQVGVFIHGLAGDLAAEEKGEDGLTARDIMEMLPEAVLLYRSEYDDLFADYYGVIESV
ncbi:NAD(P)H-hydrate dehydratase [bacterium]|nr:NAD(P)H-hydrate dehydratase [bacterium]